MAKKTDTKKVATKKSKKVEKEIKDFVEVMNGDLAVVTAVKEEPELEIMNGDPAVVTPIENKEEMENTSFHSFGPNKPIMGKKKEENPHETTSIVPETIINEAQPEESDNVKPAKVKVNKPKINKVRKIINYIWNGQEMDY